MNQNRGYQNTREVVQDTNEGILKKVKLARIN